MQLASDLPKLPKLWVYYGRIFFVYVIYHHVINNIQASTVLRQSGLYMLSIKEK